MSGGRARRGDDGGLRGGAEPARAGRRLPLARRGRSRCSRGLGFDARRSSSGALDLLRRRADPRLARARPGGRARPAAARRADQPPRHPLARVARALPRRASTRRSSSSPTTAGSSRRSAPRCSSSRPGRARFFSGPWHAWRTEQAAREIALGKAIEQAAGRDRADGALRRALPLQGDQGAAGAVARQADRARSSATRPSRDPRDERRLALLLPAARARRQVRAQARGRPDRGARPDAARRRRAPGRARRARRPRRPQRRPARRR